MVRLVFRSVPIFRSYRIIFIIFLLFTFTYLRFGNNLFRFPCTHCSLHRCGIAAYGSLKVSRWLTFSAVTITGSYNVVCWVPSCCAVDSARRKENGAKLCQMKLKLILFSQARETWSETTTNNNTTRLSSILPRKSLRLQLFHYFIITTTK